jgi:prepilin-type N-terminal cleavage/methylation domain-containing protein
MKNAPGFTLMELMVTIAIAAILSGIAIPSFVAWLNSNRLRGATLNLVADIGMAKMRAIRENSSVVVQLAADGYTIFIDNGAGAGVVGDGVRNGDEALIQSRTLPAGVSITLTDINLPNARVRFNSRGMPLDNAATEIIPVVNRVGRKNLELNRLGMLKVQ